MNKELMEPDLPSWFSTYGVLTSQRLLGQFKIKLENAELIEAINNPHSIYYLLLHLPLKNVFNGIILQQASDYLLYAQKLFIDYLISGDANEEGASQGADTREALEQARLKLLDMSEAFTKQETQHKRLIADSQASLIKFAAKLQQSLHQAASKIAKILKQHGIVKEEKLIQQAIRVVLIHCEKIDNQSISTTPDCWVSMAQIMETKLDDALRQAIAQEISAMGSIRTELDAIHASFFEKCEDIGISFRSFRSQFYTFILSTSELIKLLPDFKADEEQSAENLSLLKFDSKIGEA